jgi:hemerythrin
VATGAFNHSRTVLSDRRIVARHTYRGVHADAGFLPFRNRRPGEDVQPQESAKETALSDLIWRREFGCGIEVMDDQHQTILALINQLRAATRLRNQAATGIALNGLVDFSSSHLAFEQALLRDAGFPDLESEYQRVHGPFIRQLYDFRHRAFIDEDLADEFNSIFTLWLPDHVEHHHATLNETDKARLSNLVRDRREGSWLSRSLNYFFQRESARKQSEPAR